MATNYIGPGDVVHHTAAAAISSGDVVVLENTIGVAVNDIASGEVGPVRVHGVFEVPKVSAAVIAAMETVIYDVSAEEFDDNAATPATGDVSGAAFAVEAAGNGATTVKVKLVPGVGTVT